MTLFHAMSEKPVGTRNNQSTARLATLDVLIAGPISTFMDPVPSPGTLRAQLKRAGVPSFKTNPAARRGGGPRYYSVSAVEKFLRARTMGLVG